MKDEDDKVFELSYCEQLVVLAAFCALDILYERLASLVGIPSWQIKDAHEECSRVVFSGISSVEASGILSSIFARYAKTLPPDDAA